MKAHGNQTRASGEAYFNHPLEVAAILTEMKLDDATIAAALLHDTVEDTEATHQEIEEKFGKEIASLVDGLTKIKKRPCHHRSHPGGKPAQAFACHVEGCAGADGEAGGPAAQHAHH